MANVTPLHATARDRFAVAPNWLRQFAGYMRNIPEI